MTKKNEDGHLTAPLRAKPRGLDVELQTMARIDRLLADLDPARIDRVLTWLVGKYGETAPIKQFDSCT